MRRLMGLALAFGLCFGANADVLEKFATFNNGQYSKVDVLMNSDNDLGTFAIFRFTSWGRGYGEEWVHVSIEDLQKLADLTRKAAQSKGFVGVNQTSTGQISVDRGIMKVILLSTPGGNSVGWRYVEDQPSSDHGIFFMAAPAANKAADQLTTLAAKLTDLSKALKPSEGSSR